MIIPSTRKVEIEAVVPGISGNVAANTIVIVPEGENPIRTLVKNEVDMAGGTHIEGAAGRAVGRRRRAPGARAGAPRRLRRAGRPPRPGVPKGTTLFPETKSLGGATPSVDPTTLVGLEASEFALGLTAQGTILGVDPEPVSTLADARIRTAVDDGFRLAEASISIVIGDPIVAGSVITFPVTVSAIQARIVDGAALLARVRGLALPAGAGRSLASSATPRSRSGRTG